MQPPDPWHQVKSGLSPCWSRLVLSGAGWPCPDAELWREPGSVPVPWPFHQHPHCASCSWSGQLKLGHLDGDLRLDRCVGVNQHSVGASSWAVPVCPASATAGSFGFSRETSSIIHQNTIRDCLSARTLGVLQVTWSPHLSDDVLPILHPAFSSLAIPHTILPGPQLPSQSACPHASPAAAPGTVRGRSGHETPRVHKDSIYIAMKYKRIVTDASEIKAKWP